MTIFQAKNVVRTFNDGIKEIQVLKGINLDVSAGEMMAIIGASGSGKTTLLQICGTLDKPTSGKLLFDNSSLHEKSSQELAHFRNKEVGFIFQFHHLLPEFSTVENVMMPALIGGKRRAEIYDRAKLLLQQVELEHRLDQKIGTLSGGEQQRTALARALMMKPRLLLADEPTGNLDSRAGDIVFNLLQTLCREYTLSVIMVTHNMDLAGRMDSVRTLKDGILNH